MFVPGFFFSNDYDNDDGVLLGTWIGVACSASAVGFPLPSTCTELLVEPDVR